MKRSAVVHVWLFLLCVIPLSTQAAPSKDERNLDREIASLDRIVAEPGGEQAVIDRIQKDLKVPPAHVQTLRAQGMGYGEIITLLSLTQKMTGGVTDANIDRVRTLRQGPPPRGWGEVAAQVGAKLGQTVSQIRKIDNEVRRTLKQGAGARPGGATGTPKEPAPPRAKQRLDFPGEGKSLPQGRAAD